MYGRFSFALTLLFVTASVATAQTREVQRPPDGGAVQRIISIFIPSMPNAPFTAMTCRPQSATRYNRF
jgi:hypothetical protein